VAESIPISSSEANEELWLIHSFSHLGPTCWAGELGPLDVCGAWFKFSFFTKISAFTEITEIQWILVISVFSSVEWPKFSLEIHQFFFEILKNICILFEFLCATKMTEIIWPKYNYFSVYQNNWNSMNFNEIPLWCGLLFLSLLQLIIMS
jgi:hypothetical protein